ncbi:DUF429 domain-containing protein [Kamptonema cortianum]|nr:DUF429 domain-containing protein [Oscillatoria laete-virens]MDK3157862.1 DUF429 domain-containing protein [Kamptonema cortianum]MDL5052701.1 DUF429 domain-containing protein [Oscillatoria laete-virens NRMC-F 0139]
MMKFIGLDLAWSPRNSSGLCVLEWDGARAICSASHGRMGGNDEITGFLQEQFAQGEQGVIAIDAPVIVPNQKGSRAAEKSLNRDFRRFHAGAHPSNRSRLCAWGGGKLRAEEILEALKPLGFSPDPVWRTGQRKLRRVIEVFPHAANVALFRLDRIFQYKARPHRSRKFILSEFARFRRAIASLAHADPPAFFPENVLNQDLGKLRGSALKAHEDTLDAFICAYTALHAWRHRPAIYGDLREGYIVVPRT